MGNGESNQNPIASIKNYCIAITGGVATGKSLVASMLRKFGFIVIDADQLARDVVLPGTETLARITNTFGKNVINTDGHLDRAKMRDIIMQDETARDKLQAIMHPAIQKAFESTVSSQKLGHGKIFFYEASLIFELGREHLFRECWATHCSEETQIQRLQQRSHLSRQQCLDVIRAQMPASLKATKANHRIETEIGLAELEEKIKSLVKAQNP